MNMHRITQYIMSLHYTFIVNMTTYSPHVDNSVPVLMSPAAAVSCGREPAQRDWC